MRQPRSGARGAACRSPRIAVAGPIGHRSAIGGVGRTTTGHHPTSEPRFETRLPRGRCVAPTIASLAGCAQRPGLAATHGPTGTEHRPSQVSERRRRARRCPALAALQLWRGTQTWRSSTAPTDRRPPRQLLKLRPRDTSSRTRGGCRVARFLGAYEGSLGAQVHQHPPTAETERHETAALVRRRRHSGSRLAPQEPQPHHGIAAH
jgi:hypothetical protein